MFATSKIRSSFYAATQLTTNLHINSKQIYTWRCLTTVKLTNAILTYAWIICMSNDSINDLFKKKLLLLHKYDF